LFVVFFIIVTKIPFDSKEKVIARV